MRIFITPTPSLSGLILWQFSTPQLAWHLPQPPEPPSHGLYLGTKLKRQSFRLFWFHSILIWHHITLCSSVNLKWYGTIIDLKFTYQSLSVTWLKPIVPIKNGFRHWHFRYQPLEHPLGCFAHFGKFWRKSIPAAPALIFSFSSFFFFPELSGSSLDFTTCSTFAAIKTLRCAELISAARQISNASF